MKPQFAAVPSGAPFVYVGLWSNSAVQPSARQADPSAAQLATSRLPSSQTASPGYAWMVSRLPVGTVTLSWYVPPRRTTVAPAGAAATALPSVRQGALLLPTAASSPDG